MVKALLLLKSLNTYTNLLLCVVTSIYVILVYLTLKRSTNKDKLDELKKIIEFIVGALEKVTNFEAGVMVCSLESYKKYKNGAVSKELYGLMNDKFIDLCNYMRKNTHCMNNNTRDYWIGNRVKILNIIGEIKREKKKLYLDVNEMKYINEFIKSIREKLNQSLKKVTKETSKMSSIKLDEMYEGADLNNSKIVK